MSVIKMIIVDDHPAIAYGTKAILEQNLNYQVVDIINSVDLVADSVILHYPQIMFVDMNLPGMNGRELTMMIKKISPRTNVIMFSGFDLIPMWNQLIQAGVSGMLSKNASPEQIMRMIGAVLDGETVIPINILNQLVFNENPTEILQTVELTEREQQIMTMISDGLSNAQIGKTLIVSTRTAENYISKIYEKLAVKTRLEAIEAYRARYAPHLNPE